MGCGAAEGTKQVLASKPSSPGELPWREEVGRDPREAPTQLSLGLEGEEVGVPRRGCLQLGSPLALEQEDKDSTRPKLALKKGKILSFSL